jgi:DNA-binding NtrC family response regulator
LEKRALMRHNVPAMMRVIPVRVLVIDDDPAVCRKVAGWLRDAACDAVTFTDPVEGVAHARRAPPQVALVDLRLADTDGASVIAELRCAAESIRVIAMSAFPAAPQVIAAMRAGARDLLEKPIQQASLLEAVERQLAEAGVGVRTEEEFNQRLGARVRTVRTRADRTLAQIAELCGLTAAQLSEIELGKSGTSVWTLARICSALQTPFDRLLAGL